jgi:hypothetical protein
VEGEGDTYPLGGHFDQSHFASSRNGLELFVVFLVLYVCILIFCLLEEQNARLNSPFFLSACDISFYFGF